MTSGLKRERYVDKQKTKQGMHRCVNPAMTTSSPNTWRACFICRVGGCHTKDRDVIHSADLMSCYWLVTGALIGQGRGLSQN